MLGGSWLNTKACPVCGLVMEYKKGRIGRWFCLDKGCGHLERRETDYEIGVRIGRYDRVIGILKHTAE